MYIKAPPPPRQREISKLKKHKSSILLKDIEKYLLENHVHINDECVVIDSYEFHKRCVEKTKQL